MTKNRFSFSICIHFVKSNYPLGQCFKTKIIWHGQPTSSNTHSPKTDQKLVFIKYIHSYQIQQFHYTRGVFQANKNWLAPPISSPTWKLAHGPKMTKFIMFGLVIYHWKAHVKEISNSIWRDSSTTCPTQISVLGSKMINNWSSLVKVMSYTVGKPMPWKADL